MNAQALIDNEKIYSIKNLNILSYEIVSILNSLHALENKRVYCHMKYNKQDYSCASLCLMKSIFEEIFFIFILTQDPMFNSNPLKKDFNKKKKDVLSFQPPLTLKQFISVKFILEMVRDRGNLSTNESSQHNPFNKNKTTSKLNDK